MRLTATSAAEFLLSRRLLTPAEIVEHGFEAVDHSRRNSNVRVRSGTSRYFLKQSNHSDGAERGPLQEVAFYSFCGDVMPPELRAHVPEMLDWDERRQVLVLSLLAEARPLFSDPEVHASLAYLMATGAALGRLLAWLHSASVREMARQHGALRGLIARPPGCVFLCEPEADFLRLASGATVELVRAIQASPILPGALRRLREEWPSSALIHADLKLDNLLVDTTENEVRVFVVDWEFAQYGDARWDLGSVLASLFASWVLARTAGQPDPLASLQLMAHHLLASYGSIEDVEPLMRHAGARLIQTGYEMAQYSSVLGASTASLLQLAENILASPGEAAAALLGA